MKTVAMIPARLGSKRVPKKNIRLLDGIPMISYIIRATKAAGCFDEIYVNSESDLIGEIAINEGVEFFKRDSSLSTDSSTNDDFALDFMEKIECDTLVQVLATSPFLTPEEIRDFTEDYTSGNAKTLISVNDQKIECIYGNESINFNKSEQTPPSQLLTPVQSYACGLMAWDTKCFKNNMKKYGCAYHGGDEKTNYYTLTGLSTVDVDTEDDFRLAELIAEHLRNKENNLQPPKYYGDKERIEVDVPTILVKDGVEENDLHDCNKLVVNLKDILSSNDETKSWSKRLVNTESNSATLIHQQPGEGNREHYHPNWNEWWYIVQGEWDWMIEGKVTRIKQGDVVFIPKLKVHKITAAGDKPAVRLAVSREDVAHIYKLGEE